MQSSEELSKLNYYTDINGNKNKLYILVTISIFLYLIASINKLGKAIYELKEPLKINKEKIIANETELPIDKDLIGMVYPDISFDGLKKDMTTNSFQKVFSDFINQLQVKLIYLEKEINITKLFTFYSIRTNYLTKNNISYNDANINELHNIINWQVIHTSNQLMGIASDKYLVCKYALIKLGENLCEQRLKAYDSIEEINFEELLKKGNIILKITNGCHDSVLIYKKFANQTGYLETIKSIVKYYFQRDYGLIIPEFFHLYSKRRIIAEKIFEPLEDLIEFKFFIVNKDIKFIMTFFRYKKKLHKNFYKDTEHKIIKLTDKGYSYREIAAKKIYLNLVFQNG